MPNPSAQSSTSSAYDGTTVAFALTEFEMQRFFAGVQLPGMRWIDVSETKPDAWLGTLREQKPRIIVAGWSTPPLPVEVISSQGGSVDYVCQVTGSVRHVVSRDMLTEGLLVSNWGPLVAPLVAEHALLLLLAALRNLGAWSDYMRLPKDQQRKANLETRSLRGKRVALYGFGAIAQSLAVLLRPFQVDLISYSDGVPAGMFDEFGVTRTSSLAELCRDADILICCEALTEATRHSINGAIFASLAPGAVFVNVGRGAIVDETALIDAARTRHLRIASDVFVTEPLPPDSPLFSLPGAILSPHIAGPTHDFFGECGRYALVNITRYLAGETPESLIDTAIYDRST